jgi:hypothetical protein
LVCCTTKNLVFRLRRRSEAVVRHRRLPPGTDFTNLNLGQNLFRLILSFKFWSKLTEYYGQ